MGRVRGIELRIHATFLVLLAWFAALAWPHGPTAVLVELGFIALLFLCVVLHELGHALTAQRYGIRTHDITLLPIGGLARLERMPTESWHELWIALAGPAVNVVIAGLLYGVLALAPIPPGLGLELLGRLAVTNVALAVFNLLPAFPMDGGRVLRAALAVRRGRLWATRRAVAVGRVFAALFAVLGQTPDHQDVDQPPGSPHDRERLARRRLPQRAGSRPPVVGADELDARPLRDRDQLVVDLRLLADLVLL